MIRDLQNYLHRQLLAHGWLVGRTARSGGWEHGRAYWNPAYLQRLNFHPATIVDVGGGSGTEPLYQAFPEAYLVMVEPLSQFNSAIQAILADRHGVHVPMALGAAEGRRTIFVKPRPTLRSSVHERCKAEGAGDMRSALEVHVTTLDSIARELHFQAPYGLKLDTDGAELEILSSAENFLRKTIFIISEISVVNRFEGGYSFAQMVSKMDQLGFSVCDILDIGRAKSSEVIFFDLLFRKRD